MFLYDMGSKSGQGYAYKSMGGPVEHDEPGFLSPSLERVPF